MGKYESSDILGRTRKQRKRKKSESRRGRRAADFIVGSFLIELSRQERLAKNIPRTLDNTRIFDSTSYLTANPEALRVVSEKAAEASKLMNRETPSDHPLDQELEDRNNGEPLNEDTIGAGPSRKLASKEPDAVDRDEQMTSGLEVSGEEEEDDVPPPAPPRILVTTSPSPCKETYQFCEDLRNVFPGGEFFKRPRGRGFELGRVARWAAKRGYGAAIVVNEDHKMPSGCSMNHLDSIAEWSDRVL